MSVQPTRGPVVNVGEHPDDLRPVDLVARIGTAVTLVALMVVLGSAYAALDHEPVPTGATTAGR